MGGAWILYTDDGGVTWNTAMHDSDPEQGVGTIRCLPNGEAWAAGGRFNDAGMEAQFWYTRDYGISWQLESYQGYYPTNIDIPSSGVGFATAELAAGGSTLAAYQQQQL